MAVTILYYRTRHMLWFIYMYSSLFYPRESLLTFHTNKKGKALMRNRLFFGSVPSFLLQFFSLNLNPTFFTPLLPSRKCFLYNSKDSMSMQHLSANPDKLFKYEAWVYKKKKKKVCTIIIFFLEKLSFMCMILLSLFRTGMVGLWRKYRKLQMSNFSFIFFKIKYQDI